MSEPEDTVTLATACRLLGGDKPYSDATVRRMMRDGVLDYYGRGALCLRLFNLFCPEFSLCFKSPRTFVTQ